jgi:hypothetical protein
MLLVGDTYGGEVSSSVESKAITVDKLNKQLKKDNKKVENVAIKGKVTDVCEIKGMLAYYSDGRQFKVFC